MAWNESGKGDDPKDPWGGRDQGPADLDKIIRDWQRRLRAAFGGKGGGGGGGGPGGGNTGIAIIIVLALVAWGLTGLYRVDEAERGLVLRFGDYQTTTMPGLHWHIPYPVETVEKVNVGAVSRFEQTSQMLTGDENFVLVDLAVQYRRIDPIAFRFNVRNADETLDEVSESAIREVVGKSTLDEILLENQAEIADRTQELIQRTLDLYEAGISVISVNLQKVQFPNQVRDAVQDAVKAREDKERLRLEAEAYRNDIIPRARGQAARMREDALAYRDRLIANAEGEAARFELLLAEYQAAPEVTRERLYIESIEDVLQRSNKILLDAEGSGNLLYLPIDKLLQREGRGAEGDGGSTAQSTTNSLSQMREQSDPRTRDDPRARRTR
ncbi:FtsH protease activity modulator HflK [Lentisalinibacter orientalis]|uniref:FtsH protease activity modulator HflK n=1 Tax=Lentisalinibacter orientalis TaxID=2992241 RepID=UPI00386E19DE